MRILLGLGNPGSRYAATRHNIGWMVLDAVAGTLRSEFRPGKGEYYEAQGRFRGHDLLLVKPTTYMNNSGLAAAQLVKRYGVTPEDILVIVDEIQFPVGRVQIKPSGSSGGHNGLESLIYHLGTERFPRLRCGVGNDFPQGSMADYVLSPFAVEQHPEVLKMIEAAREAALLWGVEGTQKAMSRHNRRGNEPAPDSRTSSPESERRETSDGAPMSDGSAPE
jgi:PTH1 family peptidyl-tRNA hydrolase